MNIRAFAPQARGATGIPVNSQSLASRRAFFMPLFVFLLAMMTVSDLRAQATQTFTPQGRLTLVSNTPVMTSDQVGATTVYYTPYVGNALPSPYLGGSSPIIEYATFTEMALGLSSSEETAGNVYDIFAVNVGISGAEICAGPPWSAGGGSNSQRGTGAGSTQLTMLDGI